MESESIEAHRVTATAQPCAACGALSSGRYCAACGQRVLTGRPTLRRLLLDSFGRVANIEEGLSYTVLGLTVRPGIVVRDYLAGRTIPYTHPVGYFFVAVGIFALVSRLVSGPTGAAESDRIFAILVVPIVAATSRALLWRAGFNYAEHLIAVLYLSGHMLVLFAILYVGIALVDPAYLGGYASVSVLLALGYFVWAYSRTFFKRPLVGALAGLLSLVIGSASWLIAMALLVNAFRR